MQTFVLDRLIMIQRIIKQSLEKYDDKVYKTSYKKLIIPTVFISFGVISLNSDALKNLNSSTKYEIGEHQPKHLLCL